MTTNLRQITEDIAAALGEGWRCEPGEYDHYCHLSEATGLTLWVRIDPGRPGRLIIRCDTVRSADIYGHPINYSSDYVPSITVAATRPPASIAADIRFRLLAGAHTWWAEAQAWKAKAEHDCAVIDAYRQQFAALPGAHPGIDRRNMYGPGWECELNTSTAGLTFRSLPYDQALALLHAYIQLQEEAMHKPTQDHMFPDGEDLPLFSDTPVKVADRPFSPKPGAAQPALLDLRPSFGGSEPTYAAQEEHDHAR